jgi:hypothetical protein
MGIHYFPCHFVYWREIKNHTEFRKRLLNEIENNKYAFTKHGLIGNGYSSFTDRSGDIPDIFNKSLVKNNLDIIKEVVWDSLDTLIKELNDRNNYQKIKIVDSIIDYSWMSIYGKGGSIGCHMHQASRRPRPHTKVPSFVVVYIINDPNENNSTEFKQPFGQIPSLSYSTEYNFNTKNENEIREGVVMIFPSNLYHEVHAIEKENRIIYTFNIYSEFAKPQDMCAVA